MKRDIIENKDEVNNMINDSFGPINSANTPIAHEPTLLPQREPICVLKIELDGQNIEEIRVYEGEDSREIVKSFGKAFNLSERAM